MKVSRTRLSKVHSESRFAIDDTYQHNGDLIYWLHDDTQPDHRTDHRIRKDLS
jgi:hypothetical protein